MWDHINDCAKQNLCKSDIYLLSCLALELCIIIYKVVGAPGHGKDLVDIIYYRDKHTLKLTMDKLLNSELIRDDPNFYKVIQDYDTEENQAISLTKQFTCIIFISYHI